MPTSFFACLQERARCDRQSQRLPLHYIQQQEQNSVVGSNNGLGHSMARVSITLGKTGNVCIPALPSLLYKQPIRSVNRTGVCRLALTSSTEPTSAQQHQQNLDDQYKRGTTPFNFIQHCTACRSMITPAIRFGFPRFTQFCIGLVVCAAVVPDVLDLNVWRPCAGRRRRERGQGEGESRERRQEKKEVVAHAQRASTAPTAYVVPICLFCLAGTLLYDIAVFP